VRVFLGEWGINLKVSSPHRSRTNGRAELVVKELKKLVLRCGQRGERTLDPDGGGWGITLLWKTHPGWGAVTHPVPPVQVN
jgi:hypothetical protein